MPVGGGEGDAHTVTQLYMSRFGSLLNHGLTSGPGQSSLHLSDHWCPPSDGLSRTNPTCFLVCSAKIF